MSLLLRHCLYVADALCGPFEADSYASGSLATGRSNLVRQVKTYGPDERCLGGQGGAL
jgi:hypothetical protein